MCTIRKACLSDIEGVKAIADAHKESIGFVMRPALKLAVQHGWLLVAEIDDVIVGFCNFRHRRNGQTTIYEIVTSQPGQGVGRQLIDTLISNARQHQQRVIQLKCVQGLPANQFYQALGFSLAAVEAGKKRALNVWRLEVDGLWM